MEFILERVKENERKMIARIKLWSIVCIQRHNAFVMNPNRESVTIKFAAVFGSIVAMVVQATRTILLKVSRYIAYVMRHWT